MCQERRKEKDRRFFFKVLWGFKNFFKTEIGWCTGEDLFHIQKSQKIIICGLNINILSFADFCEMVNEIKYFWF